ncbi:MAG: phenylalanine--tRNA ligase subunit alpha [Simkaniaceae bacterium]|nr:phenylalanine--tRNA ligase subunit alpha [Simkaniaceae bacterium]
MKEQVKLLTKEFENDLGAATKTQDLEQLKVKYLGRKGSITSLMQGLRDVSPEERPVFGQSINLLKTEIAEKLEAHKLKLGKQELDAQLATETLDVTLPGHRGHLGSKHPISQMIEEVCTILKDMGFSIQYSPEIESEYYNYGGLNYPEDHPARDMQDTYYISKELLLRSHCTNIQQRIMESHEPPIRIACPGKCYRNETISTRSHVIFHQIDVMYIDKNVTFGDLLATQREFYSRIFKRKIDIRVRPSYFPFVEPGMEVDIFCTECEGSGCRLCKNTGWLEVCGAGMVHPEVLKEGGLDPEVYSGYAWGGGIERLYMLRHGISDIRLFMENDMRFLSQFVS